jgi:hypothetical protein
MNNEIDGSGAITAKGPVSGITVHSHMRNGPHAVITDQLDLVVIVELMFLLAEQARRNPAEGPYPVTPLSLLERLRELGVKSGNGSRLVGRDAVYESFARLRTKGYIRRIQLRVNNKAAGMAYEFYEFPAWNPDPPAVDQASTSSQVGATSGIAGSGSAGSSSGNQTSRSSSQVGATSGIAGSGSAGSSPRNQTSSQVGATSGIAGSPPHPPEEVGTTSPSPHKPATASRRNKQPTPEVDAAVAAAAAQWLVKLPGKWAAGLQSASSLAPWLVRNAELTGWDLDASLRIYLTRQEPGQKPPTNYGNVLGYRIRNMQPREAVLETAAAVDAPEQSAPQKSASGMPEWCGECNRGERPAMVYMRVIPSDDVDDDTVTRCPRCHPAMSRRASSRA